MSTQVQVERPTATATQEETREVSTRPLPEPPPPPPEPTSYIARELATTAQNTRRARYRSLVALAILTLVAVGAVIAGVAADSTAFWAGASVVFYMALAAVITYAANELGIVSKTATLLRAALSREAPAAAEAEEGKPKERAITRPAVAFELGERLEEENRLTEAEYAYAIAAEDDHTEGRFALGRLLAERNETEEADGQLLLAAGAGQAKASYLLGTLHGHHGRPYSVDYPDWRDPNHGLSSNVVAAYVDGREDGEWQRRDRFVQFAFKGVVHELGWEDALMLMSEICSSEEIVGRKDELAERIWGEIQDLSHETISLDDQNDSLVVLRALELLEPKLESRSHLGSLFSALRAGRVYEDAIRAHLPGVIAEDGSREQEIEERLEDELQARHLRADLRRVLGEELAAGRLAKVGAGKRGDPYRYQLSAARRNRSAAES